MLVSSGQTHAFLLKTGHDEVIAIKSGFSSGYAGEGPRGLSQALAVLDAHGVEIVETEVPMDFIQRLDQCELTMSDLRRIESTPQAGGRWYSYVWDRHEGISAHAAAFPPLIPYALMDERMTEIALDFWDAPNDGLINAYRILEDTVRRRARLSEHGSDLFIKAFNASHPRLVWKGIPSAEQAARAEFFASSYRTFRNPRSHKQPRESRNAQLCELLVVNQLFLLEREAVGRRTRAEPRGPTSSRTKTPVVS